jgi:hypothetical protein
MSQEDFVDNAQSVSYWRNASLLQNSCQGKGLDWFVELQEKKWILAILLLPFQTARFSAQK